MHASCFHGLILLALSGQRPTRLYYVKIIPSKPPRVRQFVVCWISLSVMYLIGTAVHWHYQDTIKEDLQSGGHTGAPIFGVGVESCEREL